MTAERLIIEGSEVVVERLGSGPPVLLLPGGASTPHGYYPNLAEALAEDASTFAIEPAGVGASSDGHPLRLSKYSDVIASTLTKLEADPVVAVGHSLGALIALQLAVDHPGHVSSLVLLEPTPLFPAKVRRVIRWVLAMGATGRLGEAMWTAAARREVGQDLNVAQQAALNVYTHPRFLRESRRWARHFAQDADALAAAVAEGRIPDMPVKIVYAGSHRPNGSNRRAHDDLTTLLGAEVEVWPGCAHSLHIQRPEAVAELVRRVVLAKDESSKRE